jgi:Autographiviridae RNA polymerase
MTGGRPENRRAIEDAFGVMRQHVDGVNALQAVPFVVNARVLGVVKWLHDYGVAISKNRVRLERDIETAEGLWGDRFYTPMRCDWRGRVYGIPDFKFDREDYVRGMFLFANAKPIGERGIFWLKVHLANCGDFDGIGKRSFEEREQWCDDRPNVIRMIARFPRDRASREWLMKADNPFAFLAACIELVAAWDAGPEFETCLPVLFDASSSGLQHYCAMMRSPDAWRVNLAPDMPPQDIYQAAAAKVLSSAEHDQVHAEFEQAKAADALMTIEITRKTVKPNVMTKVYGATSHGGPIKILKNLKSRTG